ncbi:bifunctional biotin--[acetyl-CoA-carboxylase] ligase/biotin operon repressor BirA [Inmirania thermothiophila]|uniref:Bifunctional ligase/repressor BirA n=1 Tax=Inmirania thermothiophila TaxID=1750597 RepID=A0A3N1Y875_9GAMM|nr:bifunctional biotin--[acetyl-CoA-carboxylase] ligase/biotin operon repressor BirA [Inmirania thermothiophila]ROR34975.1 BirA family biotin operon repressor/biotin-[acetyl-CoA-carboxylase] ligase [Inmirania thermothiophila]
MDTRWALLRRLADGEVHSGEALGRALGVSRAAVWKAVRGLADLGLEVEAVAGRGYRLAAPLELLDAGRITAALGPEARRRLARLEVLPEVDSTSRRLLAAAREGAPSGTVCLAERQTAGRGRRGRSWCSPFAASLCLSVLWRCDEGPGRLGGLSLAVGAAVAGALRAAAPVAVGLKWPNDLIAGGRKLGGILVELQGEAQGPTAVVVGIGINVRMPDGAGEAIDQPWTDLAREGAAPPRNALAAAVLDAVLPLLARFPGEGLAPWRPAWERLDALRGRRVVVHTADGPVQGVAEGVEADGALRLRTAAGLRRFHSGEVSLRGAP